MKMKPRLHRLGRLFVDRPVYFITACIHNRMRLLSDPMIHEAFVEFSVAGLDRQCYVGRYVLMPDHLHVFAAFASAEQSSLTGMSAWVKALKGYLSKRGRAQGIAAPHWQKGFFDHIMRSAESYSDKWRYVAMNPVRAGLVPRWEDWPYQGEISRLSL